MKNELILFTSENFGQVRMVEIDGKPYAVGNDVAKALGYTDCPQAIRKHCKGVVEITTPTKGGNQTVKAISQGDILRLIVRSKLPTAEKFESWVFDEVIPEVLKTGSYIVEDKQAETMSLQKVLERADEDMLGMFQGMITRQMELTKENKNLKVEIFNKENIIIGLVEDVDLATKRQRLNQIMKMGFTDGRKQSDKWSLLYDEFQRKYHCNLKLRMESEEVKPKYKNKLDYIDRGMNMIPQIYELAVKIFHNDVEKLKSEWFDIVN